jgi:hypothetical protein
MRILSSCVAVAAGLAPLGAASCNDETFPAPSDAPGFDWCHDELCAWRVERGDVLPAPTWHTTDLGVELSGSDTAIEQRWPIDSLTYRCIQFNLVAEVAEDAQLDIEIDIDGDGTVEHAFPVVTGRWRAFAFPFNVMPPFTGVRFEIAKHGPGHAAIARMNATTFCDPTGSRPTLAGGPAPLGAVCSVGAQCASSICAKLDTSGYGRCVGCDPALATCGAGQVCGRADPGPPERTVPIACVAAGARVLGEQCLNNDECATGVCNLGVCSTCQTDTACGGARCARAFDDGPYLCAAGAGRGATGAPCATHQDCASGTCLGPARRQCSDGRACTTDATCPVGSDLVAGTCTAVGVQGGSCT